MTKFREHDIEFPQCLIDWGFEDESWHNDEAARATKKLRPQDGKYSPILSVWVNYDDPSCRQNIHKYGIQLLVNEEAYGNPDCTIWVGDYDDLQEVVEKVLEVEKLIS